MGTVYHGCQDVLWIRGTAGMTCLYDIRQLLRRPLDGPLGGEGSFE